MISKRLKIVVGSISGLLLLLSLAAIIFAYVSFGLTPMIISDSSPELSNKVSDEERTRIFSLAQGAVLHVSIVLSILAGLWAAFAGSVIWLWSRSSQKILDETRVA